MVPVYPIWAKIGIGILILVLNAFVKLDAYYGLIMTNEHKYRLQYMPGIYSIIYV